MKEFDSVLPVRFGTVASDANEIRNLLDRRCMEFKNFLQDMEYKIELDVKAFWQNMDIIFSEIVQENQKIKILKDKIEKDINENKNLYTSEFQKSKIELGKLVQQALTDKKANEADNILQILQKSAFDYVLKKPASDEMVINSAFLVNKGQEKEFDNTMEEMAIEHNGRIKFIYTGPLPVFNFVNITIYPEEWEK